MNKNDKEFLEDLGVLLKKHDVNIYFDYDDASDIDGLYDERIVITHNKTNEEIFRVDDYGISASDFKEYYNNE